MFRGLKWYWMIAAAAGLVLAAGCSKDAPTGLVADTVDPSEVTDQNQSPDFIFLRPGGEVNGQMVNPGHDAVSVGPGESLRGTVNIRTDNNHGPGAIVPVVYAPTWGDHESSWVPAGNAVPGGTQNYAVDIDLTAPEAPGTYYLIFAMAGQTGGEYLASMSAWWACDGPVWGDGNDLADLTATDLAGVHERGFANLVECQCNAGTYARSPVGLNYIRIDVSAGPFTPDAYTMALWHCNEGSGSILHDSSPNGNDGTISGATWSSGRFGGALQFDGIDDFVRVAHQASLDYPGQITIDAWVNLQGYEANASFVCKGENTGCYALKEYGGTADAMHCSFDVGGPWSGYTFVGSSPIPLNQWVLLSVTYDGTTSKIYVNGQLDRIEARATPVPQDPYPLYIGADPPGAWNYVHGKIDEIRISSIVRY